MKEQTEMTKNKQRLKQIKALSYDCCVLFLIINMSHIIKGEAEIMFLPASVCVLACFVRSSSTQSAC